jgi:ABC-type multidrug transport system fused ATPase/permease subunit
MGNVREIDSSKPSKRLLQSIVQGSKNIVTNQISFQHYLPIRNRPGIGIMQACDYCIELGRLSGLSWMTGGFSRIYTRSTRTCFTNNYTQWVNQQVQQQRSIDRLFELLNQPEEAAEKVELLMPGSLLNVHFSYHQALILHTINLSIKEATCLCGTEWSGKTTL